jgi:hypothetical protein
MTYSLLVRELHTRKALRWPASAASTKAIQLGQHDQIEVMYAQNTPTPKAPTSTQRMPFRGGCLDAHAYWFSGLMGFGL